MTPPPNISLADATTVRIAPLTPLARISPEPNLRSDLPTERAEHSPGAAHLDPARQLVAGVVPGRVDFSSDEAAPTRTDALPMYAHPAQTNAAATGVHAGRLVDLNA